MLQTATRLATVSELSPDHPDRIKKIGNYWREVRKHRRYSRREIVAKMGIREQELAFFEQGLVSPLDLPEYFIIRLAEALGVLGAYNAYIKSFPEHP